MGDYQLFQQFGKAYIPDSFELPACCVCKSAGDIRLTTPCCTLENNVVPLLNVAAGGVTDQLGPIKLPLRKILNLRHICCRKPQVCVMNPLFQFVFLATVPFRINQ